MNACPNCGSELRFDIASQSLLCSFCGAKENPETFSAFGASADEHNAAEEMDAILYSCPQCGGSIYSTEESVNGFCSYCGSNIMLKSRMVKMKYPRYVAPFRIDKKSCKEQYLKHARRAFFAPKELKDPEFLERFRGIYMTYWGYNVHMEGFLSLDGIKEYISLPWHHTEEYKCMGWVNAEYRGMFFDASSTFEDHYSEQIAPFNYRALVKFNPAYLSGFYADLPDLDDTVYDENAVTLGKDNLFASSQLRRSFPGLKFDEDQKERFREAMDARCSAAYTVFFPVWFLSYRNGDNVAYAVVNGQTGKLVCDLPIDRKKFLTVGLLLSVPIFLLLHFLPAIPLRVLLILSEDFSLLSVIMLLFLLMKVHIRRQMLHDKGWLTKHDAMDYRYRLKVMQDEKRKKQRQSIPLILLAGILVIIAAKVAFPIFYNFMAVMLGGLAPLTALILSIILEVLILQDTGLILRYMKKNRVFLLGSLLFTFASSVYGDYLLFNGLGSDPRMYAVISGMLLGTVLSQLLAVDQYNQMVCRPLPQLMRKGGDDNAV
ncbi:MAG: hypothetical protein IKI75_02900 [Lachnospiraceae bacterium]|nr:hypothetical protein [Lachnospiraceae bacterium]